MSQFSLHVHKSGMKTDLFHFQAGINRYEVFFRKVVFMNS